MKRFTLIIAALVLALAFTACAAEEPAPEPTPGPTAQAAPEPTAQAAPEPQPSREPEESAQAAVGGFNWGGGVQLSYYGEGEGPGFEFASQTLAGEDVDQEIFTGKKVTMVNVWGTYCPPCLAEMPDLGRIAEDYAGEDFQIIGIVCDVLPGDEELTALAQELAAQTGADYQHILASETLITNMLMDIYAVPTSLFLDAEGKLICSPVLGSNDYDSWAGIIDELLAR